MDTFVTYTPNGHQTETRQLSPIAIAAKSLSQLWHELRLDGNPHIFVNEKLACLNLHYQGELLDKVVSREPGFGNIYQWQRLSAPSYAQGISELPLGGTLREYDFVGSASTYDRNSQLGPLAGWYRYDFSSGWSALAVMLYPDDDGDAQNVIAINPEKRDEWLAFQGIIVKTRHSLLHEDRRGAVKTYGSNSWGIESIIKETHFEDIILDEEVSSQVAKQRRIWDGTILAKMEKLGVPRKRVVLLVGPPGTGKTSLIKAEANRHLQEGGYVIYVSTAKKAGCSWELLESALSEAKNSELPTLICCDDFEQFVTADEDFQHILNVLDGINTPDNPAGTLILASTNEPERIDPRIKDRPGRIDLMIEVGPIAKEEIAIRFLQRYLGDEYQQEEHAPFAVELIGSVGAHIKEMCLLAAYRSLEEGRDTVSRDDLAWAHKAMNDGRIMAEEPERHAPSSPKKRFGLKFEKR